MLPSTDSLPRWLTARSIWAGIIRAGARSFLGAEAKGLGPFLAVFPAALAGTGVEWKSQGSSGCPFEMPVA